MPKGGGCFLSCHAVGGSGRAPSHLGVLGGLGLDEQATTQLCRAQGRRGLWVAGSGSGARRGFWAC